MTEASALRIAARGHESSHYSEPAASHGFRAAPAGEKNDRDPAIAQAVARAKSGDMDAIHFLYLRYKDNIYGYVLSILRDAHEAEDATQTVFMKLISAIHNYEPRQVPFTAWILRVAHNVAVDSLRQRRPVPCEEVIESSRAADDSSHEARRGLEQALETLSEDCQPHGPHRVLDPRAASPRAPGHAPRAHPGGLRPNHPRRQSRRPCRTRMRNADGAGPARLTERE
jgi:Sigma-70 region 2